PVYWGVRGQWRLLHYHADPGAHSGQIPQSQKDFQPRQHPDQPGVAAAPEGRPSVALLFQYLKAALARLPLPANVRARVPFSCGAPQERADAAPRQAIRAGNDKQATAFKSAVDLVKQPALM